MPVYPPIADYALVGDCHSVALVSRAGSVDWCCLGRIDSGSCFGRLLDWERGGHCAISPVGDSITTRREYLDDTLVLATTFESESGEARVLDCFTMRRGGSQEPYGQLLRVVEGVSGHVELNLEIAPRFDYGELHPWIRRAGMQVWTAVGGNDGLLIWSDTELEQADPYELEAKLAVRGGERVRLSIVASAPATLDARPDSLEPDEVDKRLDYTIGWWRRWASDARPLDTPSHRGAVRSAIVLKALTNAPSGAIAAAATTSLPESPGGERNWDYRFSWIRDSVLSARSLTELGFENEADGFRRFIQRSSAGDADRLQILYGVGGERRLTEQELGWANGYRGAQPVRIGNASADQLQLDAYGELLNLAWRWHRRGHSPDDDLWRFIVDLVDVACERWQDPDSGIWEWRDKPLHFVHSKAACWSAIERGIELAEESMRRAPTRRWRKVQKEIAEAIEAHGYDEDRGVFVQAFDTKDMDAALLLLPVMGFVDYTDERMVRTTDAVRKELDADGLLYRYRRKDGLKGQEGAFLACSFWLAECLARQGRGEDAQDVFDRATQTANDLGLFGEEYDPNAEEILGNYPQGLTHLSHIAATVALAEHGDSVS
ncbi:MAG: glycoside hydrolase family 15 protein [Thermoleophilaceae bacterium]